MTCNVIYSVCRAARIVYQHPNSPWNISRNTHAGLPLLRFLPESPVYFDRHTLSIKNDRLSLFTLDGRMRFRLDLSSDIQSHFRNERLREIALLRQGDAFVLNFRFDQADALPSADAALWEDLPEYLLVLPDHAGNASSGDCSVPVRQTA